MRHSLFTIGLFFLLTTTKAQCPDGAYADVVFYIHQIGIGSDGYPIIDTSNTFYAINFQPNTTVYLYNNYNTLIDSVYTSVDGSGYVILSPSVHDSIWPAFISGFTSLGTATNGICTTGVGGVGLLPVKISNFFVARNNNTVTITWQTEMDEPGTKYIIQQSDNGTSFTDITTLVSTSNNTDHYSYSKYLSFIKTKYFRIKVISRNQSIFYSETKAINANVSGEIVVSAIAGNRVSVSVPENFVNGSYSVYNNAGSLLSSGKIFLTTFILSPNTSKGVYFVRVTDRNGRRITKSFIISD